MGISTINFGVVHENKSFSKTAICGVNEVINSVNTTFLNIGVNISFSGNHFTVAGKYTNMYSPATWKYIPVDSTDVLTISNFSEMPDTIGAVIEGKKLAGSTVVVTFTVNTTETVITYTTETGYNSVTDSETGEVTQVPYSYQQEHIEYVNHDYAVTQKVSNVWDDFKNQLTIALSRSQY